MGNTRKPGGGRKPSKPEYSAERNLVQQMEAAVLLYKDGMTLQAITDALSLNPIKVRKLLITAGVYESDTAKLVQQTFNAFRETQDYSTAVTSTMSALQLSRPSVTSYLPYEKGVYFPEEAEAANISAGAERQRHYRAVVALRKDPCEENLWKCVVAFRGYKFKTLSGLPFTYKLKKGRGDEFTKELWIDRREDTTPPSSRSPLRSRMRTSRRSRTRLPLPRLRPTSRWRSPTPRQRHRRLPLLLKRRLRQTARLQKACPIP